MRLQAFGILAAVVGSVVAQGVTSKISPDAKAPEGCKASFDGQFEIAIVQCSDHAKRNALKQKRGACSGHGILVGKLSDSVFTDAEDRTGYIASNYQFQFDGPPQAGAIYTAGFSSCSNGSLALGGSTIFWQCKSGNFYNLYDRYWAPQCEPVEILVMPCGGESAAEPTQNIVGTTVVPTTVVVPLSDGQPQVITTTKAIPLCQIDDGQVQRHTTPCAAVSTPATTHVPASQYSDGQIQVTPGAPAHAPTGTPQGTGPAASVSVPKPPASGVPNGTTPRTTAPPPAPTTVPTTAPPTSGAAGRFQLGSATALAIGALCAVWTL